MFSNKQNTYTLSSEWCSSERKVLRDCYMYPARCKLSLTMRGSRADQRISLISSTSSNTTSGIVSDRVHSEDEPDAGPISGGSSGGSAEDSPANLIPTSMDGESLTGRPPRALGLTCQSLLPEVDTAGAAAAASVAASNLSGIALGSQCSSTCSTVVASASATAALINAAAVATGRRRRTSASSSLELGYSHTAQNSAISAEPGYDRCSKPAKYAGECTPFAYKVDCKIDRDVVGRHA